MAGSRARDRALEFCVSALIEGMIATSLTRVFPNGPFRILAINATAGVALRRSGLTLNAPERRWTSYTA